MLQRTLQVHAAQMDTQFALLLAQAEEQERTAADRQAVLSVALAAAQAGAEAARAQAEVGLEVLRVELRHDEQTGHAPWRNAEPQCPGPPGGSEGGDHNCQGDGAREGSTLPPPPPPPPSPPPPPPPPHLSTVAGGEACSTRRDELATLEAMRLELTQTEAEVVQAVAFHAAEGQRLRADRAGAAGALHALEAEHFEARGTLRVTQTALVAEVAHLEAEAVLSMGAVADAQAATEAAALLASESHARLVEARAHGIAVVQADQVRRAVPHSCPTTRA